MSAARSRPAAALLALLLSACAAVSAPVPPPARPVAAAPVAVLLPADKAIPPAQQAGAIAALDAALKSRLSSLPLSDAWRRIGGGVQPPRLVIEADRAFEAGTAQLRPALLLPLAEAAAASRVGGAWVLHAIGRAPTAAEADLAERRAASVIAYLGTQGIAASRLRAETRSGTARQIELHFEPIVEGREAQAWMPPAGSGPAR